MNIRGFFALHALLVTVVFTSAFARDKSGSLLVYVGAASKPPTEEIVALFEQKHGVKVDAIYGGSGYILSQMKITKEGDIYFPGSSDYMEKAMREGDVFPETEKIPVYLVSAINVQRGNPHNVRGLRDLLKPGLKVAIANPEGVCVGAYAVEIIEKQFSAAEKAAFRKNLINYTASCELTATAISLKQADAVIGWSVFEHWDPARIETVPLKPGEIPRIGYIPLAVASYTKNRDLAQKFIDFVVSDEGREIFAKYKYFPTPESAVEWLGEEKPVGGEYAVPPEWLAR